VGRGIEVRAQGEADDAYAAFDVAAAHLDKRLRRNKRRLRTHHAAEPAEAEALPAQQFVIASAATESLDDEARERDDNPVVIAEVDTNIESLSVSEAVMRMDLRDLPALMFRNRATGAMNMVYVRHDGNIGWIEPTGT